MVRILEGCSGAITEAQALTCATITAAATHTATTAVAAVAAACVDPSTF